MEEARGTTNFPRLVLEQLIPPLPNTGRTAVSWLRSFAGASWIAYGARGSVVIATAPGLFNTGDGATCRFFQQVIDISPDGQHRNEPSDASSGSTADVTASAPVGDVVCVAWGGGAESRATLAAACGSGIFVYEPVGLTPGSHVAGEFVHLQHATCADERAAAVDSSCCLVMLHSSRKIYLFPFLGQTKNVPNRFSCIITLQHDCFFRSTIVERWAQWSCELSCPSDDGSLGFSLVTGTLCFLSEFQG